jgi:uracil-DNA glycosylase family 4
MQGLLALIKNCKECDKDLELGANPILSAGANSKIVIIGQAPGRVVHKSGIPWDDKSGDNLRAWMGIDKDTFYNTEKIALIPMGFCYPGTGKTGDLPPRKECAPLWHSQLIANMTNVKLILLVGQYAQNYYLADEAQETLTATVQHFKDYLPKYFPLPHPSPRNNIWQAKNIWFDAEVLPKLRAMVKKLV